MRVVWIGIAMMCVGSAGTASAAVPARLGYQGRLLLADGTPATGVLHFTFSLFGSEAGGEPLYTETQSLGLTDGFYSTYLGAGDVTPGSTPLAELFDGGDRYLEIAVEGEELTPRHAVASVPYALTCESLVGGAVNASSISVASGGSIAVGGVTLVGPSGQIAAAALPAIDASTLGGYAPSSFVRADDSRLLASSVGHNEDGTHRGWVDVKEYGGAGDGVTDDTGAIQAAVSGGGLVYLPAGYWKITAPIAVSTNTALVGAGMGRTTVLNDNGAGNAFEVHGGAGNYLEYATFEDMTITSSTSSSGAAISATYARYGRIANVELRKHGKGLLLDVNCYYNEVVGNVFAEISTFAVHQRNFGANYFARNRFDANGAATSIMLFVDVNSHQTLIEENIFSASAGKAIVVLGSNKGTNIVGNSFSEIAGANAIQVLSYFGASPLGTNIVGNTFRNNPGITEAIIKVDDAAGTNISGNTFSDNHASNPDILVTATAVGTNIGANSTNDALPLSDQSATTTITGFADASGRVVGRLKHAEPAFFPGGDATPSVKAGNVFRTQNSSATAITNFDDGALGQMVTIRLGDPNTRFTNGAGLRLQGNANWTTGSAGDVITFVRISGTEWTEVSRSINN